MQKIPSGALLGVLFISTVLFSCKKDKQEPVATTPLTTPVVTPPVSDNVIKDSTIFYTRDIYLWNTQVPASFDARSYADPDKIMTAIRQYSIEPGFSKAVDRFSFAIKQEDWDNMSAGLNSAHNESTSDGDFGLSAFFRVEGDLRVRMVEPASPAGIAGIKRGWQITKINSNSNITTGNANFIVTNIYDASTVSLTFKKPDGNLVDINLTADHYKTKPVYLDSVYTINNKKVGYLVYNSFLGDKDNINGEFQRVFSKFSSAGISDIVVDLRYNGGGYVALQEKLANYLANSAANGNLMMKETFNAANSGNNKTTNFKKLGSLNFSRVYFIVGPSTASASELLINNLKPYMDVKLVGSTTNGKPVGFFPIPVGEWYIFPVSFKTTNKNGEGNYFDGFKVNSSVADGLDKDWGDVTEKCLANVIKNISTGSFRLGVEQPYVEPENVATGNKVLDNPFLKVTVADLKDFK